MRLSSSFFCAYLCALLYLPATLAVFEILSLSVEGGCKSSYSPGVVVTLLFPLNNPSDPTAEDTCYVALRSDSNNDVIAAQIYPHPKCNSGSAQILIPNVPETPFGNEKNAAPTTWDNQ